MDWAKTTTRRDKKQFGVFGVAYYKFDGMFMVVEFNLWLRFALNILSRLSCSVDYEYEYVSHDTKSPYA